MRVAARLNWCWKREMCRVEFFYPYPSQLGFVYRKHLAVTPSPSYGFAMRGKKAFGSGWSRRGMRRSNSLEMRLCANFILNPL